MDFNKLAEIRKKLSMLPAFEDQYKELLKEIREAEEDLDYLLRKYKRESMDVERLKEKSFTIFLQKLFGKYDSLLDKETQEMIKAKRAYNQAAERIKQLYIKRDNLGSRITDLKKERELYKAAAEKLEQEMYNTSEGNINPDIALKLEEIKNEQKKLYKQLVEIDEAIRAAANAKDTAKDIYEQLQQAEGWGTFDIWLNYDLIANVKKYEHINKAEADYNRLSSYMKDLEKELRDISPLGNDEMVKVKKSERVLDFWFDNIFTDISVRDNIRYNKGEASKLMHKLSQVIDKLNDRKNEVNKILDHLEQQKNDIILSNS